MCRYIYICIYIYIYICVYIYTHTYIDLMIISPYILFYIMTQIYPAYPFSGWLDVDIVDMIGDWFTPCEARENRIPRVAPFDGSTGVKLDQKVS